MKIGTAALRRALFDSGPDAVICVDDEGNVIEANPRAFELFGYDEDELIGLPIQAVLWEDESDDAAEDGAGLFVDPKSQSLSGGLRVVGRRKDGSEFPASINLSPQRSREGNFVAAIVADISELREAERHLRDSEERYRHLIENTPDGYFIHTDGTITFINPSAVRMLGASNADQILGRPLYDFIHPDEVAETEQRVNLARKGMLTLPFVNRTLRRLDQTYFEGEMGSVRIPTNDGTTVIQTIIRDLTEKHQAEQLQIRALAAEEGERLKSNLLSTVSHELRTPLTAVRGYATTVLEYADYLDKDEMLDYMKGIDTAAQHLEKIVADLLTLSRIEGGVYRLDLTDFDACDFVRNAVTSYLVAHPDHLLHVEPRAPQPLVSADSSRVLQVLHNLLDNARKYGGDDTATKIAVTRSDGEITISVRDPGPGVEAEALDRIFQPFVRGSSSQKSEVAGSGLGLAVCKAIIEAHGGRIWASLPPEGGFEVSFSLPAAA
ncbi:MAG: PAS domain S-box protein [Dehalococcoidia bacterium]